MAHSEQKLAERHERSVARPGRSRLVQFTAGALAFSRWPLRVKLAASFLVVSLLPVAVIALVEVRETVRRIFDDETELLAARAEQLAGQIDAFHLGYRRAATRLAAAAKVIELLHAPAEDVELLAAAQANRLHSHLTVDTAIRGIAVIGPDLRVIAATEPALAHRELGRSSYLRDALIGTPAISEIFVAEHEVGDVPTIGYASPVRGAAGDVIGAVVFWIRADALWELAQQANGRAGAGSFAVMLDHDGIRLAHTASPDLVFHPAGPLEPAVVDRLVAEQRFGPRTRELLRDVRPFAEPFARARAAAFDPGLFEGVPQFERRNHYGVGRRLRLVPWTVFQLVPATLLAAPVGDAVRRHVVFAVLVGLVALIAGGAFARRIAAPLAGLTAATRRLARGERGVRVELGSRDELGALGAAFNAMADELYQSRTGLEALVGQRTAALVDANRELRQREHSLVVSEQRFRDLYEKSPDMYLTTDVVTLQIVDCNQTLCRQLGYERAELLGRPTHAVYPPGEAALVAVRMAEFLTARGELTDLERVLQCKDGRLIHTSLSASPIRDRDGKIVQARMVWRDISSRKRADADQQFLLGLADVLRSSTEPGEVQRSVCAQLASYLGASRCLFAEVDLASATATVDRDYHGDQASVAGVLPLSYFGREAAQSARRGLAVSVGDTASDPRTAATYDAMYRELGIRALLSVPLLRDGAWVPTLVVTAAQPRVWHDHEIALAKLVAERVWGWVEHLRVLAELREQSVRRAEHDTEARLLRARQGELARSLKEREVLLQEIHHRVKNNLQVISSLINMQVRKLEHGTSRDALEQCQTRVLAIALIHERLYQSKDYSAVHFAEYARSLAATVFHALGVSPSHVELEVAIDDIPLGIDRAIPCGLVLNELMTNALKHAFRDGRPGTLRVALTRLADGRIRLSVGDDGAGIPAGFDIHQVKSMGLQLVCTLAEQLEAELVVTGGDAGTSFQLTFAGDEVAPP